MFNGQNFRPVFLKGTSYNNKYCIGKIIKDSNVLSKRDYIKVIGIDDISSFTTGYLAYLFEMNEIPDAIRNYLDKNKILYVTGVTYINTLNEDDVIEINSPKNTVRVIVKANSFDNAILVTNQCNSNCLICPDSNSFRQKKSDIKIERIKKIINLIDFDIPSMCITGGEPTLLKESLFDILGECKLRLPKTNFLFLTNGRMFYYKDFAQKCYNNRPAKMLYAIPIYGHLPQLHDQITNVKGSFIQTINGIRNLYELGEVIELRIVVNKLNYKNLVNIASLIVNHFPKIAKVNIMALEMTGSAYQNKSKIWVDFEEIRPQVYDAVRYLYMNGVKTYLYNFPLCKVDEGLWQIAAQSISDNKVRFFNECQDCLMLQHCGGFFNSIMKAINNLTVTPIVSNEVFKDA